MLGAAKAPEIASHIGLDRSDVHKTLKSLRRLGIVKRDEDYFHWIEADSSLWDLKPEKSYPNLKPAKPKAKKKKSKALVAGSYEVAQFLYDSIKSWFPSYYAKGQWRDRWAKDIDKLIRIDKQNPDHIKAVILKMSKTPEQASGFSWRKNILSGKKLRDKFPKLKMQFKPDKIQEPYPYKPFDTDKWETEYADEGTSQTRSSGGTR